MAGKTHPEIIAWFEEMRGWPPKCVEKTMRQDEFEQLDIDPEIKKYWLELCGQPRKLFWVNGNSICYQNKGDNPTIFLLFRRTWKGERLFFDTDGSDDVYLEEDLVRKLKLRAFE